MNQLSVAMIAHNEQDRIAAALAAVAWADQMVVVDSGSTDRTGEIAAAAGAVVHCEVNRPNLNVNKNIAIDHCSGEWVLVLDADEMVSDLLAGEIRRTVNSTLMAGFLIPRRNHLLGRWLRRGSQYPDLQLRLFRRGRGRFPADHVHERLRVDGPVGVLSQALDHHPYPTLEDMFRKNLFYAQFESRHLYESGRRTGGWGLVWRVCIAPGARFFRRFILKGGFLDGVPGLAAACLDAWNQSARWLGLWDLQRREAGAGGREQSNLSR